MKFHWCHFPNVFCGLFAAGYSESKSAVNESFSRSPDVQQHFFYQLLWLDVFRVDIQASF